ncbi:MAG: hypothetical protein IJ034_00280 [Mailhella sp.]|nr:hypothetical protein [Mailhella sp.]MBQ8743718.1 hypothetical protein [Mailhella sp.]
MAQQETTLYGAFVEGVCKGWKVATLNMLPNVVLAFVFIKALQISGFLDALGDIFAPLMAFFGLPGEAVTVLISTWFSAGGGIGAAAGLYAHGVMDSTHVSIVMPAIFLMGAQIQYVGRILGVAGVDSKHYPMLFCIGILNALLAMLTMKWLIV